MTEPGSGFDSGCDSATSGISRMASAALLICIGIASLASLVASPWSALLVWTWPTMVLLDARHHKGVSRWVPPFSIQLGRLGLALALGAWVAMAFLILNLLGRLAVCVDHQSLGLMAATVVWASLRKLSTTATRAPTRAVWLVSPGRLATSLATFAIFALLDLHFHFRFLLLGVVLLGALAVVIEVIAQVCRDVAERPERAPLGSRMAVLATALALTCFLAVTKLSALGNYQLTRTDPAGRAYELAPSRRAEIDRDGFRGPLVGLSKDPGTVRIAVLGDSATYGWLVAEAESFPRVLERELRARLAAHGVAIEVLNAGVPAYDLPRMTKRLEARVLPYRPDVVVLVTGRNDRPNSELDYHLQIDEFVDVARTQGAQVVLTTYPSRRRDPAMAAHNSILSAVARGRHLPFVDLDAMAMRIRSSFFLFEGHPSASGHRAIATALVNAIEPLIRAGISR